MASSDSAAIPAHSYTPEQLAKERRYLARIGNLMGTDQKTLSTYAKIKLWEDGPNYQKVVKYVNNSQCHPNVRLTVVNIHRVWRRGDALDFFQVPNRMLLWHGTKRNNIPNILDNGFVLPRSAGQMFGPGIYFADRITKSTNYTDMDKTFLLLCEVSLGKHYSCKQAHNAWTVPPEGFDSVKANGTYVPDWSDFEYYMGSKIPNGKTALCTKYPSHAVNFNEFIVYDPSRIIIRFLVEVTIEQLSPPIPISLVIPKEVKERRTRDRQRRTSRNSGQQRQTPSQIGYNNNRSAAQQSQGLAQVYQPIAAQQQSASQVYQPITAQQQNVPKVYQPITAQQQNVPQVYQSIPAPRVVQPSRAQLPQPIYQNTTINNPYPYISSQTQTPRTFPSSSESDCCGCAIL